MVYSIQGYWIQYHYVCFFHEYVDNISLDLFNGNGVLALYHEYITKLIFFLNCYSMMRMYLSSHIVHVYLYIPLYIHHISIISHKISHTATIKIDWDGIFHLSHQHHQQFLTISHDFPWFPIFSHVFLWYIPIIGWYTPILHWSYRDAGCPGRRRGAVADCLGHLGAAPQWLGKDIYVRNSYNVAVGFSNYDSIMTNKI